MKITGLIGKKDFAEVLDEMCDLEGRYDDNDNFIPDYEFTAAIRHLDLGGATYVDGDELPYFGYHTQLETLILPHGIKSTLEEDDTGFSESESLRTVIFPEGLKIIGGFAFSNGPLSSITIGKNVMINGVTDARDYKNGKLASGKTLDKAGDET